MTQKRNIPKELVEKFANLNAPFLRIRSSTKSIGGNEEYPNRGREEGAATCFPSAYKTGEEKKTKREHVIAREQEIMKEKREIVRSKGQRRAKEWQQSTPWPGSTAAPGGRHSCRV